MNKSKINVERLISARYEVSNAADETRPSAIKAEVVVENNEVTAVDTGTVSDIESGVQTADFSYRRGSRLSVHFRGDGQNNAATLAAIEAFVADCTAVQE